MKASSFILILCACVGEKLSQADHRDSRYISLCSNIDNASMPCCWPDQTMQMRNSQFRACYQCQGALGQGVEIQQSKSVDSGWTRKIYSSLHIWSCIFCHHRDWTLHASAFECIGRAAQITEQSNFQTTEHCVGSESIRAGRMLWSC